MKTALRAAFAAFLLASLAGCASLGIGTPTTNTTPAVNPAAALQQFTLTDVQNALADATANHDVVAANCYTALEAAIKAQAPATAVPVSGVLSAFQKLRDLQQGVQVGLPALNIPCAPLVLSTQQTLVRLGVGAGTVAILGPMAPALGPAIGAIP